VVIGNVLSTRKFEVVFVSSAAQSTAVGNDSLSHTTESFSEEWLRLPGSWVGGDKGGESSSGASTSLGDGAAAKASSDPEIESLIVNKLIQKHMEWMAKEPAV
jgi:hypothetical protein